MDHVKHINLYGVEFRQKTCIPGKGAPTSATEGAVGEFYMDTNTGTVYKCTAAGDKTWTWEEFGSGDGSVSGPLERLELIPKGADEGCYLLPEGSATKPVLAMYGTQGDEETILRNIADPEYDIDAVNLGYLNAALQQVTDNVIAALPKYNGEVEDA